VAAVMAASSCYMNGMKRAKPKADEIEGYPDAWERFEKAFDTVMKAKPKPVPAKKSRRALSLRRGGTGGGSKSA
jgi:hypothetical protein